MDSVSKLDKERLAPVDIIRRVMRKLEMNMPSIPSHAHILEDIRRIEDSACGDIGMVSDVVARDPAIAARFVSLANTVFIRRSSRREVASIAEAISRIGTAQVKNYIFAMAIDQLFVTSQPEIEGWFAATREQSLFVAVMSRMLAARTSGKQKADPDTAYMAGLMHNIGMLPILRQLESDIDIPSGDSAVPFFAALLAGSGAIAQVITERWGLGQFVSAVVRDWSRESAENATPAIGRMTALVRQATLCHEIAQKRDVPDALLAPGVSAGLFTDRKDIDELIAQAREQVAAMF